MYVGLALQKQTVASNKTVFDCDNYKNVHLFTHLGF